MFASTVLNYMDRQAIALVDPQIKAQFALDNRGYGWVLAAFQLSYAFFQWPAGYLVDRWIVRRTYAGAVLWWSFAGIATAFAPSLGLLMTFRALLGIGESFNWPCALWVTAGVLPPSDRSLGNGIFNSGAAIGAVLTPLIVTPLAVRMGWRYPFVILGFGGLVWVATWLMITRSGDLAKATPARDRSTATGLSSQATLGFTAVLIIAIATTFTGWLLLPASWQGAAVWWGRGRPHDRPARRVPHDAPGMARRSRLGQEPWRDRLLASILGGSGGRDHHQRDLALPGELDGDLLSGRSQPWNAGGWYGQRLTVLGRRIGLLPLAGLAALLAFWRQEDTKPAWTDR